MPAQEGIEKNEKGKGVAAARNCGYDAIASGKAEVLEDEIRIGERNVAQHPASACSCFTRSLSADEALG